MSSIQIRFQSDKDVEEILSEMEKYINCHEHNKESITKFVADKLQKSFVEGRRIQMVLDEGRKTMASKNVAI